MNQIHPAAFDHVPILRDRIVDPGVSSFRMSHAVIEEWDQLAKQDGIVDWRYTHAEREAYRRATVGGRLQYDIWIFAYGSLMWDPGFYFSEVRYATLEGAHRAFRLADTIGRGSPDRPGLMAGLERGGQCEGLAFRISAPHTDSETAVIWMREMICPGYLAEFHPLATPQGEIEGVAFMLDSSCESYAPNLSPEETTRRIALGRGPGGSSRDYLEKLVAQLTLLQLTDPPISALMQAVQYHPST